MGGRDYSLLASVLEQLARDIRSGAVEVRAANAEESNTYAIKDAPGFELNGRSGQLTVKWFRALAQAGAGSELALSGSEQNPDQRGDQR